MDMAHGTWHTWTWTWHMHYAHGTWRSARDTGWGGGLGVNEIGANRGHTYITYITLQNCILLVVVEVDVVLVCVIEVDSGSDAGGVGA